MCRFHALYHRGCAFSTGPMPARGWRGVGVGSQGGGSTVLLNIRSLGVIYQPDPSFRRELPVATIESYPLQPESSNKATTLNVPGDKSSCLSSNSFC